MATAAPTPNAFPSPTPTAAIDVTTVPATIDEAYLEAVMAALDAKYAEALRQVQKTGDLGEDFLAAMLALQTPQEAEVQVEGFRKHIGIDGLARPPRPPTTDVRQILEVYPDSNPGCVYFTATRDVQPLASKRLDVVQPYYIALEHSDPNKLNPTAWRIGLDTYYREREPPKSVCGAP